MVSQSTIQLLITTKEKGPLAMTNNTLTEQSVELKQAYHHPLEIRLIVKPYDGESLDDKAQSPRFKLINRYKDNCSLLARIFTLFDVSELLVDLYFMKPHNYGPDQDFYAWLKARMSRVYSGSI